MNSETLARQSSHLSVLFNSPRFDKAKALNQFNRTIGAQKKCPDCRGNAGN
jgi:hypothetical protein